MDISVVIRAYNEEMHIERLLYGIQQQKYTGAVEVILVDSGSTDSTVAIARDYDAKIVSISKDQFTFGRSLNYGIAAASHDLIVIVSAHVYPFRDDWLANLVNPLVTDAMTSVSYGMQRGDYRTKYTEHKIFEKWFPFTTIHDQPHPFCNNANCAIRRSDWVKCAYDETLTGLEDIAWARLRQAEGKKVCYVAEAPIAHVHQERWSQIKNRYRREAVAMKAIDPDSKFSFLDFCKFTIANIYHDTRSAMREKVARENLVPIILFRYNQFFGTYLGYASDNNGADGLRERFYYPQAKSNDRHIGEVDRDRLIVYPTVPH